jgi:hypothetical protein
MTPHYFSVNSVPAPYFQSSSYGEDLTKFSTYETMTGSAFSDFGSRLADEFGLGSQPIQTINALSTVPKKIRKKR